MKLSQAHKNLLLKTGRNLLLVLATLTVYTGLILSLLPLISWWGGLIAMSVLIAIAFLYYTIWNRSLTRLARHWLKISFIAFFLGIIAHTGCRLHSNILISDFYEDCQKAKAEAINR